MVSADAEPTNQTSERTNDDCAGDSTGQLELIQGNTEVLHSGHPAPGVLTIGLRRKVTGEIETHTFQVLSAQALDGSDRFHLTEVSRWRYNIFKRRGIPCDRVNMPYFPIEEAWLLLLHKKIKAVVEAGHNVKISTLYMIVKAFNQFFLHKILRDANGHDLLPREARDEVSLHGKIRNANFGVDVMRKTTR